MQDLGEFEPLMVEKDVAVVDIDDFPVLAHDFSLLLI